MRRQSSWLALVLVGACGTAASAQAPYPNGMQPYAPYPYGPMVPNYAVPGAYAPPVAYPQPRVLYVPATPTGWPNMPMPTQQTVQPVQNTAPRAAILPAGANSDQTGGQVYAQPMTVVVKSVPAKTVELRQADVLMANPENCGSDCGDHCAAPAQCCKQDECRNWLPKGHWDKQFLGGYYGDMSNARYQVAQANLRLGHVWDCPCWEHMPGAFEGLIEVNAGSPFESDFGNYFVGSGLLLRYNFVQPCSRLVPYLQVGVGFQYNDAYTDTTQPYLGSRMNLTAQGQVGMRLFLCKSFSIDVEGGYQHVSDLGMSHRDHGVDMLGGMLGCTYFFPCCGKR